jgi:hypothetical protein
MDSFVFFRRIGFRVAGRRIGRKKNQAGHDPADAFRSLMCYHSVGFTICGWLRPGDPLGFGALGPEKGNTMSKDLYVTNIALEATEEEVRKLFSVVGKVAYIHLVTDAKTGQFKGCGYVKMASEKEAREAITTLDGARLINRIIKVTEARPQKTAGPKGGAERRPPVRDKGPGGRRK